MTNSPALMEAINLTVGAITGKAPIHSDKNDYRDLIARLHPAQREIFDSAARFRVAACGRRFGKTEEAITEAIIAANLGKIVWWIDPSYPMAVDVWRNIKTTLKGQWEKQEQQHIVRSPSGGEIRVRSADNPDSLRGSGLDLAIFDEAALMAEMVWTEVIRPALSDRQGRALFLSTPKGLFNWFYALFEMGISTDEKYKEWQAWNKPSWTNPLLDPAEIERARASLPADIFDQEYGAQFSSAAGMIYDNFSLTNNVSADADYNVDLPVQWGVDDGYAFGRGPGTESYHPRVILLTQRTVDGGLNVFAEYYKAQEADYLVSIDNALALGYPAPSLAYIDSSAAMFKANLWNKNITTFGATHTVIEGIRNVRRLIQDANEKVLLRIHPRCQQLIREMQTYRYDETAQLPNGDRRPAKLDDHGPDALRYVCWPLRYGGTHDQ